MTIKTHCPNCHSPYNLAESQRGKKVRCRKCADVFVVGGDDVPAAAGSASGKLRKDALQTSPRPPERTPPPRTKPAAAPRRDRDDEGEDDRPVRRPPVKKKSGSSMPMILLIGGGVLLLFLMCGGAAIVGAYYWAYGMGSNAADNFQNGINNIQINDPNNPWPPINPADDGPKDVGEAMDWIRNAATADKQNKACDWLATANVDEGRKKDIDELLLKLVANTNTRNAADRALGNWARPEDASALLKEVDTNRDLWGGGQAGGAPADALIRMKYKPAAAVFAKRLPDFIEHGNAARRLAQMGADAEPDVLHYMDHPNKEAREEAATLLTQFGTAEDVKFSQALTDLRSPDSGYERGACDYLAKAPVNEARRKEVAKALQSALSDRDGETRKAAALAMGTWATKDDMDALIAEMDRKDGATFEPCVLALTRLADDKAATAIAAHLPDWGGNRDVVVRALRTMGPPAEKAVAGYVNHSDQGVRTEAEKLIKGFGTKDDVIFAAMIDDLGAKDANQRKGACEYLANHAVDAAKQKQVDRALEPLLDDKDPFAGVPAAAAKALGVWGDKDSVSALIKAMQKQNVNNTVWQAAVDALVQLKDERAVVPLIQEVNNFFHKDAAKKALAEMGPLVEMALDDTVADQTAPAALRVDAIRILSDATNRIATAKSLPVLLAASSDANADVKKFASAAYAALKKRIP